MHRQAEAYIRLLIGQARLLAELADRDRHAPTFGCFFYPFWRSKSSDYVNARCQEAAYTLALIYRNAYPGNIFQGMLEIGELARAAMLFWAECQHRDGSFDEWYKGEHGFAATAFSSFALSRAYRLLEDEFSDGDRNIILNAFRSAGHWLGRHDDTSKINHEAVAAAALASLAEVLEEPSFDRASGEKIAEVLRRQTEEGWFPELGGVDTGYSFLTLEYLAQAYLFRPDEELKDALARALEFLLYFVHPDVTTGREYNLCGNSYVSLLGAAIMAEFYPPARGLFREGVGRSNILAQLAQDDLSRCYHLYNGIRAYEHYERNRDFFGGEESPLPYQGKPFQKYFPTAGLMALRAPGYYAVCGCKHGGLLKIFSSSREDAAAAPGCNDLGYTIRLESGQKLHSFLLASGSEVEFAADDSLRVTAGFRTASYFFPHLLARLLLKICGLIPGGYLLVKKGSDFIRRRKKASFQLTAVPGKASGWVLKRSVSFGDGSIRVRDEIASDGSRPDAVEIEVELRKGALVTGRPGSELRKKLLALIRSGKKVAVEKTFTPAPDEVKIDMKPAESGSESES